MFYSVFLCEMVRNFKVFFKERNEIRLVVSYYIKMNVDYMDTVSSFTALSVKAKMTKLILL